ncbi:N-formylglutamate deformylase [Ahrensia sp. 13_GOM-1096m]|uniref:N-formylglutamate deformylase n=1 Tax=Ahrensia sp. 13_GOM-1096m TaxID=1380380 RepID=UPI00047B18F8|nr:N-formylglutamate deformylase [Ahrensia sp. 13_GOM-1096m]
MKPVDVKQGGGPIVLGLPHTGTFVPKPIYDELTDLGKTLADTDWHIDRLYEGLSSDVTSVRALFHRYVVDANRDPSGVSLYPGQNTTGLVPLTDFDGERLWLNDPTSAEIEERRLAWHAVYHAALEAELKRVHAIHGFVILYDCHSIRSNIPFLFDGTLPDFNIGTNGGLTCDTIIEKTVVDICKNADGFTSVLNGRFKGGWTTRHYGKPAEGFHAIQMELAQANYLETEQLPFDYDAHKAKRLRVHLDDILKQLEKFSPAQGERT